MVRRLNLKKHFGAKVKSARETMGYTQKALGAAVGVDGNSIARLERGEQGVRWNVLERIIEALGQPASYFFSDTASPIAPRVERPSITDELRAEIRAVAKDAAIEAALTSEALRRVGPQRLRDLPFDPEIPEDLRKSLSDLRERTDALMAVITRAAGPNQRPEDPRDLIKILSSANPDELAAAKRFLDRAIPEAARNEADPGLSLGDRDEVIRLFSSMDEDQRRRNIRRIRTELGAATSRVEGRQTTPKPKKTRQT